MENIRAHNEHPLAEFIREVAAEQRGDRWDQDFFEEACDELTREFKHAPKAVRHAMLADRYFDATRPARGMRHRNFAGRFAIDLPFLDPERARRTSAVRWDGVVPTAYPESRSHTLINEITLAAYGPSRICRVPPGMWAALAHPGDQDVIGTHDVTACSIMTEHAPGHILLAHVSGSDLEQIRLLAAAMPRQGERSLIAPYWVERGGGEKVSWNKGLHDLAELLELRLIWIPYVGYDTEDTDGRDSTSVILGKDFIRTAGVKVKGERLAFPGDIPRYRAEPIASSVKDYATSGISWEFGGLTGDPAKKRR